MKVRTVAEAWTVAHKLVPTSFTKDDEASKRAGYPVYMSIENDDHVNDLNTRLEVVVNGECTNIWIKDMEAKLSEGLCDGLYNLIKNEQKRTEARMEDALRQLDEFDVTNEQGDYLRRVVGKIKQSRQHLDELKALEEQFREEVGF